MLLPFVYSSYAFQVFSQFPKGIFIEQVIVITLTAIFPGKFP